MEGYDDRQGRQHAVSKRRRTIRLPKRIADRLRKHCRDRRVSLAELILSAYLSHREKLKCMYTTQAVRERLRVGLAPEVDTALYTQGERSVQLGIYIDSNAFAELESVASRLGLTRRRYIAELLHLYLPAISSPDASGAELGKC